MKTLVTLTLLTLTFISFAKNKTWHCLKEDGSVAFTLEAKYVHKFSDGLADVKISSIENNAWVYNIGFVDKTGKMVIQPQYEKVKGKGFVNGRAWVKKKDSKYWTLIDKQGNEIPTANYDKVGYIHEINGDLLCVYQGDRLGFINRDGKEIIPCKYIGGTTFHEGLVCVTSGDGEQGYGFMDKQGNMVIPMQFKQAGTSSFMSNGMCRAGVNGRTVLIDKTGKTVFSTKLGNIQGISNGWIRVFTNNDRSGWGYINFDEEWMIKPIYNDLKEFDDKGCALAQKGNLWGIIDTNNNVKIPFKYETLYYEPEEDGFILGAYPTDEPQSMLNTPKDYFTADFEPITLPEGIVYVYPADGANLMGFQDENKKNGFVNRSFKVVIPAKYSRVLAFTEGRAWVRE
ncbi:MAG: WG repeat-containing protein [Crocinitomicaceae bacterium]|nr:WG repeat-containing protein [Crocinitomicaceae bacterium]